MQFNLNIDVKLLREQRDWLLSYLPVPDDEEANADGLINLLDAMLDQAELERELRLDEERIADQMTADELRGITAPDY